MVSRSWPRPCKPWNTREHPYPGIGFPQYSLSRVVSMFTCSVLRCSNPGAAFAANGRNLAAKYHEAYVCARHKAMIDGGEPWDVDGQVVLMGRDLAPILQSWCARPCTGSAGFTLTLEITGHIVPVEIFLLPAEARDLSSFISRTKNDGEKRL